MRIASALYYIFSMQSKIKQYNVYNIQNNKRFKIILEQYFKLEIYLRITADTYE